MICVSIGRGRHRHMIAEHRHLAEQGAKLVEFRLDYISGTVNSRLARRPAVPVVVACRRPADGGKWAGTEEQRQPLLRTAIAEASNTSTWKTTLPPAFPASARPSASSASTISARRPTTSTRSTAALRAAIPTSSRSATWPTTHDNVRILEMVRGQGSHRGLCMGDIGVPPRSSPAIRRRRSPTPRSIRAGPGPGPTQLRAMTEVYRYDADQRRDRGLWRGRRSDRTQPQPADP